MGISFRIIHHAAHLCSMYFAICVCVCMLFFTTKSGVKFLNGVAGGGGQCCCRLERQRRPL